MGSNVCHVSALLIACSYISRYKVAGVSVP